MDAEDIKYAEELLAHALIEWRDAGGAVETVTGAILRLIVAREKFAAAVCALGKPAAPVCAECGQFPGVAHTNDCHNR